MWTLKVESCEYCQPRKLVLGGKRGEVGGGGGEDLTPEKVCAWGSRGRGGRNLRTDSTSFQMTDLTCSPDCKRKSPKTMMKWECHRSNSPAFCKDPLLVDYTAQK